MLMNDFVLFASTLAGISNPSVAIAGSRAGGIGLLDLELETDKTAALKNIEMMAKYAGAETGVKLSGCPSPFLQEIVSTLPKSVTNILLTYKSSTYLEQTLTILRQADIRIYLECVSLHEASVGEKLGVDGLVAKGQEAGGRVGREMTFILLQHLLGNCSLPVFAHGGIGLHSATACYAAGAAGVLLDSQLALTRESPLPPGVRESISRLDGRETACVGELVGVRYRVGALAGKQGILNLQQKERELFFSEQSIDVKKDAWSRQVMQQVSWTASRDQLVFVGQDVVQAQSLAQSYVTVGGILQAFRDNLETCYKNLRDGGPIKEHSNLATSHGTRYPIVQGPMARVSDTAEFAKQVAGAGALPFIAAAWLREKELNKILEQTASHLQEAPWGVGVLGFLPAEVYQEQVQVVIKHAPAFVLVAGGRVPQVKALEAEGITAYVHVPTPGLFKMFLESGLTHFVFEGREAGGHVGPYSSFVLWELMIAELLGFLKSGADARQFHLLFAGGIKDDVAASMISFMAAPLAECGVRLGLLLGSAYLFTHEAVKSRAVVKKYQEASLACQSTILLKTGPGHEGRCVHSPFTRKFRQERVRLLNAGVPPVEIREALETLELGRLRIASKGLIRNEEYLHDNGVPKLLPLPQEQQWEQGVYMVGQVAALQDRVLSMEELHRNVVVEGGSRVEKLIRRRRTRSPAAESPNPSDIAIIGLGGFFPEAPDVSDYWENILNGLNTIREIPKGRWDWEPFFREKVKTADKIYSKWGAFLDDVVFDPLYYGMPPKVLASVEPLHLLTLEAVRKALADAGYDKRPFDREQTGVILGVSGAGDLAQLYGFRTYLPMFFGDSAEDIVDHFGDVLPEWTEDSFPGILMNVAAGRIANRFDFGGANAVVDAACASSLAALYMGVKELESGSSDMVVVGGADCMQNPFTYMCFSQTQALSPRGVCNALDADADGIVIGEGIAVLVMKRLADAERDGDRIYSVIKAVGASSDGRDRSLTAPGRKGQVRALRRAYSKAGISAAEVELVEAHATGTAEGDRVEIESLTEYFQTVNAERKSCALGSVKSMIGHTKSAAGLASLMKAVLALHHKTLPPTIGVSQPNPGLQVSESPFYINTQPRPWMRKSNGQAHKAGVSAFGFGGTNYHVVLEEYQGDFLGHRHDATLKCWPSELFVWHGTSREQVVEDVRELQSMLSHCSEEIFADLAYTQVLQNEREWLSKGSGQRKSLTIVATSVADLKNKLEAAQTLLASSSQNISDPRGIFFSEAPLADGGKIAFLFPGQGSQYVNQMVDLAVQFDTVRKVFERSDHLLQELLPRPLSSYIFPPQAFSEEEKIAQKEALAQTQVAQPAMGTANLAMQHLLGSVNIRPDMVAGHSYGEYSALCAAGAFSEEDLVLLSEARARFIIGGGKKRPGAMAAVKGDLQQIVATIDPIEGVWIGNVNSRQQIVITGEVAAVTLTVDKLNSQGLTARRLPVSCGFHSPLMEPACSKLAAYLHHVDFDQLRMPVFSNTSAAVYADDVEQVKSVLVDHLVNKVEFVDQIEAMYALGGRIFVEVGPGRVLTGLVENILQERPHIACVSNQQGRHGLTGLHFLFAELIAHGVDVQLDYINQGRNLSVVDFAQLGQAASAKKHPPGTWLVNGSRVRQVKENDDGVKAVIPYPLQHAGGTQQSVQERQQEDLLPANDTEAGSTSGSCSGQDLGERDAVMFQYQHLMQQFVETQQEVMLKYLQGEHSPKGRGETSSTVEHSVDDSEIRPVKPIVEKDTVENDTTESEKHEKDHTQVDIAGHLLDLVVERTGYPLEMLDMDADLEAELGVDSIKRVEIFGQFFQDVFPDDQGGVPEAMEALRTARSLGDVVQFIETVVLDGPRELQKKSKLASKEEKTPAVAPPREQGNTEDLPRFLVYPVELHLPEKIKPLPFHRIIVLTDDGRGVAEALCSRMQESGYRVAVLAAEEKDRSFGDLHRVCTSYAAEDLQGFITDVQQQLGQVCAIVHLFPLKKWSPSCNVDRRSRWKRIELELQSLLHLLQGLGNDLVLSAQEGAASVVAATGMGGKFAFDPVSLPTDYLPLHGGVGGFLKTLALEWSNVRVKAIDFSMDTPAITLAQRLFTEIQSDSSHVEIGYNGHQRLTPGLCHAPIEKVEKAEVIVEEGSVILVTGGARGITATIALDIAREQRPILILAGRSPFPHEDEPERTAGLTSLPELKKAIISKMQTDGEKIQLADVERKCQRLLREREMRDNVRLMREAGSRVVYHQVDVSDEHAFSTVIEKIYQDYDRLDGVVHGAGIIEDKLVVDKQWASFSKVLATKAESVYTLEQTLRPEKLQFLVLFSSVAGRFGNRGQCDYTATNEIVNKLARKLDRDWPGRVVAIDWGPWGGAGMASEEVQRQFRKRKVPLISLAEGASAFLRELRGGCKGDVEVVLGDGPWKQYATLSPEMVNREPCTPLLQIGASLRRYADGRVEIRKNLIPTRDKYLMDHCLEGRPVLPATMAIELMAEASMVVLPGWHVSCVHDVRVFKGVPVDGDLRDVVIEVTPHEAEPEVGVVRKLAVSILAPEQPTTPLYKGRVILEETPQLTGYLKGGEVRDLEQFPLSIEKAYQEWLFHGPLFQCIVAIEGVSEKGMTATLTPSHPENCILGHPGGHWVADPVILDGGLQMALLWARKYLDITVLPSRFKAIHIFRSLDSVPLVRCQMQVLEVLSKQIVHYTMLFTDQDGEHLAVIEQVEATGSKALNRLTAAV